MEGYVLSEDGAPKASVASRLRTALSTSARRAGESLAGDADGYTDLGGEAVPASRVEEIEAAEKKGSAYTRAARLLRGDNNNDVEEPVVPATDAYVTMDDGPRPKHSRFASTLSRASAAVLKSFKSKPTLEVCDGGSRLSSKPYVDELGDPAARNVAAGNDAAQISASAALDAVTPHSGGLWALKARLVTVDNDRQKALADKQDAERRAEDRRETLDEATARCARLQRRELFLRELLRHSAELPRVRPVVASEAVA